jgi:uncharacterized protein (TIGR02444 family)
MSASQSLDTPLWAFSLAVYSRDGVADECLDLQERLTLDVNLLLFAAFAGAVEGVTLDQRDIAAACGVVAGWHDDVVRTLRAARRGLKAPSLDASNPYREAIAALRAQVKPAELGAEKIELGMLWQWSRRELAGRRRADADRALAANLRGVLEFYRLSGDQAAAVCPRLLDAAASYVRPSQ